MKNIKRLAEIGEKELNRRMENYVHDVYVEYLHQEENPISTAYGMNFGLYLERRREFVECGLDPSQYDDKIRVCLKGLDIETETSDIILKKTKCF